MEDNEEVLALLRDIAQSLYTIKATLENSTDARGVLVMTSLSDARWS